MLWEGKALRDLREPDIRTVVTSGLEEHLHLEYKSELYENSDRGRKEFLLDLCMFANASGGILLIGIPERRDENGQATGTPDHTAALGLDIPNPEAVLTAYDARVMESVEERLPLESVSIDVGEGRRVLVLRVANSVRKPHSVRHQGHIYFPSRRERQRYSMNVREIKEMAMAAASQYAEASEKLGAVLDDVNPPAAAPVLRIALLPVFFEEFSVNVTDGTVHRAIAEFSPRGGNDYKQPVYTFDGIERDDARGTVTFRRNGLLSLQVLLPLFPEGPGGAAAGQYIFAADAMDLLLHNFVIRASALYEATSVSAPFILGLKLQTAHALSAAYPSEVGGYYAAGPIPPGSRRFPFMQILDISRVDETIHPLCDQANQMFGRERSRNFDDEGQWVGR